MRAGFERMVAEVCLGKVGAVAAREVSRFARNSRDWQQLVEMCRVVDTLLIDQETIYAPRQGNDRLLARRTAAGGAWAGGGRGFAGWRPSAPCWRRDRPGRGAGCMTELPGSAMLPG
jgi:hypothetical protein